MTIWMYIHFFSLIIKVNFFFSFLQYLKPDSWTQREDDEICMELRKLQKQLKEQIVSNNSIKNVLYNSISQQLAKDTKQQQNLNELERSYWKMMVFLHFYFSKKFKFNMKLLLEKKKESSYALIEILKKKKDNKFI